MAFASSTVQQPAQPANSPQTIGNDHAASLLGALVLTVYAAQKSQKNFRKMKRRFLWTAFKLRMKSFFSKRAISDRTLIYILLAVIALVLIFTYPLAALILALVALILILAGVI